MQKDSLRPHRARLFCALGNVYAIGEREISLIEQGQKRVIYRHAPSGFLARASLFYRSAACAVG